MSEDWFLENWIKAIFGLISAGMLAALRQLFTRVKSQKARTDAIQHGMQALLRNEIIKSYHKYMDKGWIPIYALENVNAMYREYHALGGNGTITQLAEELQDLPKKEPKAKNESEDKT